MWFVAALFLGSFLTASSSTVVRFSGIFCGSSVRAVVSPWLVFGDWSFSTSSEMILLVTCSEYLINVAEHLPQVGQFCLLVIYRMIARLVRLHRVPIFHDFGEFEFQLISVYMFWGWIHAHRSLYQGMVAFLQFPFRRWTVSVGRMYLAAVEVTCPPALKKRSICKYFCLTWRS